MPWIDNSILIAIGVTAVVGTAENAIVQGVS